MRRANRGLTTIGADLYDMVARQFSVFRANPLGRDSNRSGFAVPGLAPARQRLHLRELSEREHPPGEGASGGEWRLHDPTRAKARGVVSAGD